MRDYTTNRWRRVDDYPYGDFAGTVMRCEPIDRYITALETEKEHDEMIFVLPDGEQFNQRVVSDLSMKGNTIILYGYYRDINQRIRDHPIIREISTDDHVLTDGKLVAAVMTDAIIRLVPGVVSNKQSALSDSFQDNMLSAPIYTRPANYKGQRVPEVLLDGNEAEIKNWGMEQALERTHRLRPDLLEDTPYDP